MPDDPMFEYILEPQGLPHLRVPNSTQTLCGLETTDEWSIPSTTKPVEPVCRGCFRRVQDFVVNIMKNGKRH